MRNRLYLLILCVTAFLVSPLTQASDHPEQWYQERWCAKQKGKTEVTLSDRTRVDCLTDTHAVELDFGRKWSEAIGQSLGYAIETNKRPGIVLILETSKDYKYWIKLNSVIDHYKLPIDTWATGAGYGK